MRSFRASAFSRNRVVWLVLGLLLCGIVADQLNGQQPLAAHVRQNQRNKQAILFVRDGTIYTMKADGSGQRRLWGATFKWKFRPTLSPDGTKELYADGEQRARWISFNIFVRDLKANTMTQLTNAGNGLSGSNNEYPTFSSDGKKIAFASGPAYREMGKSLCIHTMNVDGTGRTQLTKNYFDYAPVFSPDDSKIAFLSKTETFLSETENSKLFVMNADETQQIRLTNNPASDWNPVFSADSKKITFVSNRDGNNELYIVNVDGTHERRLTKNRANDDHPIFSPNGTKIAFTSNRDGNNEIYTMNVGGTQPTRLTNNKKDDHYPQWWYGQSWR